METHIETDGHDSAVHRDLVEQEIHEILVLAHELGYDLRSLLVQQNMSLNDDFDRKYLHQTLMELYHELVPEDIQGYYVALISTIISYLLIAIALSGIIMNGIVFWKLGAIIRAKPYLNPAVVLRCMCACDIFCLLFLFSYPTAGEFMLKSDAVPNWVKTAACKTLIYVVHVATAFSVWCWMALSAQRYVALEHPLLYRRYKRFQQPSYVLIRLVIIFFAIEIWMFILTDYDSNIQDCREHPENLTYGNPKIVMHVLQIVDVALTYLLPVILMLLIDLNVRRTTAKRSTFQKSMTSPMTNLDLQSSTPNLAKGRSTIGSMDVNSRANRTQNTIVAMELASLEGSSPIPENAEIQVGEAVDELLNGHRGRTCQSLGQIHLSKMYGRRRRKQFKPPVNAPDRPSTESKLSNTDKFPPLLGSFDRPTLHLYTQRPSTVSMDQHGSLLMSDNPTPGEHKRKERKTRSKRMLRRYFMLSGLDLMLNLPRILLRLVPVSGVFPLGATFLQYFTLFSYILYYAQHSINILYIWVLYPSIMKKFSR